MASLGLGLRVLGDGLSLAAARRPTHAPVLHSAAIAASAAAYAMDGNVLGLLALAPTCSQMSLMEHLMLPLFQAAGRTLAAGASAVEAAFAGVERIVGSVSRGAQVVVWGCALAVVGVVGIVAYRLVGRLATDAAAPVAAATTQERTTDEIRLADEIAEGAPAEATEAHALSTVTAGDVDQQPPVDTADRDQQPTPPEVVDTPDAAHARDQLPPTPPVVVDRVLRSSTKRRTRADSDRKAKRR
jgi:hypothetical protein